MKAIRAHARGGPEQLFYEDAPQPEPHAGEVLVRVRATGITPMELTWSATWQTPAGAPRPLAIPGHDLAGTVAEIGPGVAWPQVGEDVFGLTDFNRDGGEAEYAIALPNELAAKPKSLDYTKAAAVPLVALTAWQALFDHAGLRAGQRILVQGAAGGVGTFAVQLARWAGAHVIATTSARNADFVRQLGADEVVDYTTVHPEDVVRNVDVVFDAVGGAVTDQSWPTLRRGGLLITIVAPPSQERANALGVQAVFFVVHPDHDQLTRIGGLIDDGIIRPIIDTVLPLERARTAYEQGLKGHTRGKIVLEVS